MSQQVPPSRVLSHLGVMAVLAVVLGVVVAGIAIPFAGIAGISARQVAKAVDDLPATFDTGTLPQTTRIVDANGNLITTLYDQNRVYRPLDQISRNMTQAIVSIEDYRFYQHGAIDLKGTLRAFVTNQANSGTVQGGSSITQQLVKQTLLTQAEESGNKNAMKAATADTYARKLKELRYAIALEQAHSKDWILERYLNTAYFGDGAYGVQAAARHYFNVNSNQLTVKQSALLAGLVKNPTGYDPTNFPDAAVARRNVVLDREAQLHVITSDQADALKQKKLGLHVQSSQNGCVNATAPFFCDYVINYLERDPDLGKTVDARKKLLTSGGLTIHTTLESPNQRAADSSLAKHVYPTDNAVGGIAEVEPGTGNVLALAQSRPMGNAAKKGQTYINYTIPQELGGSAGFQAGSTFKLFVLASAIEDHIPTSTKFNSQSPMTFNQADYKNCAGAPQWGGPWVVHNETGTGIFDMYKATQLSINTYFTQLERLTGICQPFALAKQMGVDLTDPDGDPQTRAGAERTPSFTLGIPSVSPLEMAGAYATFAARGEHCDPRPVTEIDDAAGTPIKTYAKSCKQVIPDWVADQVNDITQGVQQPANARNEGHAGFGYELGHTNLQTSTGAVIPSAGKTGTTQSDRSVWFDGYTPQISTVAMIAGANEQGTPISLDNVAVGGYVHSEVSGSGFAGPMWADAMHPIQSSLDPVPFHPINVAAETGVSASIPSVGGLSYKAAEQALEAAGFHVARGSAVASTYAAGTVVYGTPSGTAPTGSVIMLYTSTGHAPAPPKQHKKANHKKGR
ncbi:transglycosylase domain-containing protein [Nocardioides sp. Iso805N]|uniref:transglycosylase domain-containing protein n=1 Tax=Nocardioides sp. Iso805N TaxID=1283287 RepID=UPI0012F8E8F6|nr:transglycosylase domain-containing protein [Nocardioides sp. Iso805N]